MMPGLGGMIGGGPGLLSGATSSAGYRGKEFSDWLTDAGQDKSAAHSGMDFLSGAMTGKQPLMSQADINRLLSGQNARLEAGATAGRQRAGERAIARGEGRGSGMLESSLAGIDRSLLDAKRQTAQPLYGQLAQQMPEYRLRAAGMMLPFLQGQQGLRYGEHNRMEELAAARAAQGSAFHRALAGGAAGFAGGGGFDFMQSPRQAGGGNTTGWGDPNYGTNNTWQDNQWIQQNPYYGPPAPP